MSKSHHDPRWNKIMYRFDHLTDIVLGIFTGRAAVASKIDSAKSAKNSKRREIEEMLAQALTALTISNALLPNFPKDVQAILREEGKDMGGRLAEALLGEREFFDEKSNADKKRSTTKSKVPYLKIVKGFKR